MSLCLFFFFYIIYMDEHSDGAVMFFKPNVPSFQIFKCEDFLFSMFYIMIDYIQFQELVKQNEWYKDDTFRKIVMSILFHYFIF